MRWDRSELGNTGPAHKTSFRHKMAAIVPYAGRRLATLTIPQARALSYAYTAGKFAYNNRATLKWAGKSLYRAARSMYRKRKHNMSVGKNARRRIGERVGTQSCKKARPIDLDMATKNTRTLYAHELTILPETSSNLINRRQRDIVNLRGFKICMQFLNIRDKPMLCNVAIISPKDNQALSASATSVQDFFRNMGLSDSRSMNFDNTLRSSEFHCHPINVDKYYVLMHKRFKMPGFTDVANYRTNSGNNWRTWEKYIRLKRQLRFQPDTTFPINGRIFLVYWYDGFANAGGTVASGGVSTQVDATLYFKEPKS